MVTMPGILFLVGLATASAFTAPPGISLSNAATRACSRATSRHRLVLSASSSDQAVKIPPPPPNATGQVQMVSSSLVETANATGQIQMVSSSPRWPGDKEARDGVELRPKIDAPKVDKMWVNDRYVVSTKILETKGNPGAKWPANIFQSKIFATKQVSQASDQAVVTGDMAEAKQSATIIAMCILLAQPILSAGYYQVKSDVETCSTLLTCRTNYVSKVTSIGEFKETAGDSFERYAKNYMVLTQAGTATSTSSVPITKAYSSSLMTRPTIMTPSMREAKEREAAEAAKPKAAPAAAKPATAPAAKATVAAPKPAAK